MGTSSAPPPAIIVCKLDLVVPWKMLTFIVYNYVFIVVRQLIGLKIMKKKKKNVNKQTKQQKKKVNGKPNQIIMCPGAGMPTRCTQYAHHNYANMF